jgi:N-acyl-D-aspartate/D-glutamate deacylase
MHDLVIRAGTIVDGTGHPAHRVDVAVRGGQIIEERRSAPECAGQTIDALARHPAHLDRLFGEILDNGARP